MNTEITGLSSNEVKKQKSIGLSNEIIDTYSATYFEIIRRNVFSLINIILIPLLVVLLNFGLYKDVLAFSTFAVINTVVSMFDEIRIKRKIDRLKSQFQLTAKVIRDGKEETIAVSEIVMGDYVKAKEGEGIIADGEIVYENYLQTDDSVLTGESNYLRKEKGEKVLSGSYVVTGNCIYVVNSVGRGNYLNKLGEEALKYKEKKSQLQKNGDKLIFFLVFASIILSVANFYLTQDTSYTIQERILSLTSIIVLIIPQTLIFLFTLTFTVSIAKLYNKGILIQKGGSIEELSKINVICFDKTGTITTNDMKIIDAKFINLEESAIGTFYNSVKDKIVGVNKTQSLLNEHFSKFEQKELKEFDQVPFTSKQKYSLTIGRLNGDHTALVFGATSVLSKKLDEKSCKMVEDLIKAGEVEGNRMLLGLYFDLNQKEYENVRQSIQENSREVNTTNHVLDSLPNTNKIVIFKIEETLNPGIKDVLENLKQQNIAIKIISGDSLLSVKRIMEKLGFKTEEMVDLSEIAKESGEDRSKILGEYSVTKSIFTRAKPEDKLEIINILKSKGYAVAMVGDGINDVLSIKAADVSIAMESGSKITREVADIVLLSNDFSKIPDIFFEGDNIIFNLKLSTKMFLQKSFLSIILAAYFTLTRNIIPIHPASTLIFSFLGSSLPSYIVVFTRQKVQSGMDFMKEVIGSSLPASILYAVVVILFYYFLKDLGYNLTQINSAIILFILSISIIYSIYLIWEAKKIRNIAIVLISYALVIIVGTFQTILPITQYQDENVKVFLIGMIAIGMALLAGVVFKLNEKGSKLINILIGIACIIGIPIAAYFPFADYYSVTRIDIQLLIQIQLIAFAVFVALVCIDQLVKLILRWKK